MKIVTCQISGSVEKIKTGTRQTSSFSTQNETRNSPKIGFRHKNRQSDPLPRIFCEQNYRDKLLLVQTISLVQLIGLIIKCIKRKINKANFHKPEQKVSFLDQYFYP